jgi:hypothetical protein
VFLFRLPPQDIGQEIEATLAMAETHSPVWSFVHQQDQSEVTEEEFWDAFVRLLFLILASYCAVVFVAYSMDS